MASALAHLPCEIGNQGAADAGYPGDVTASSSHVFNNKPRGALPASTPPGQRAPSGCQLSTGSATTSTAADCSSCASAFAR